MSEDTTALPKLLEREALDRFLHYVRYDTQSAHGAASYPSTAKQLTLLRQLRDELEQMGYTDATIDSFGYVTATLPSTLPSEVDAPPVIAFFAHVDTSPDVSGKNVRPLIWRAYDGRPLQLIGDPSQTLSIESIPALSEHIGHDIVTSDGTTLLGADDKAGVAAIMAAAAYLKRHPELPHGTIKWVFNPDEEVGHGVDHLDLQALGATYAYTLDAGKAGEVQEETFSADLVHIRFFGISSHPGTAKGKMVNAIKVAAAFVASLPRTTLAPEVTGGREGFVHPTAMSGGLEETSVSLIVRDFETPELAIKEALLRHLAETAIAQFPGSHYELTVIEQYRNMRDILVHHPQVVALADEAVRRVGLQPLHMPIRGGTDGSRLTERGLPTPNLFAGWQQAHSRQEWVCVQDLALAAATIVTLVQLWAEQPQLSSSQRKEG